MALRTTLRVAVVLSATILTQAVVVSASGADREYGDMVAYDLTFPIDGASQYHYGDTFWAYRVHGYHHAQDLMADKMVPVLAAASGVIRLVNWSNSAGDLNPERCCSLVLDHDDGWESRYLHLNNDTPGTDDGQGWGIAAGLVPGSTVSAGDVIGWVGDSGNAEGTPPHLHFELRDPEDTIVNSYEALRAVDPQTEEEEQDGDAFLDSDRVLWSGSRGGDVRRLQEILSFFGINPGPIDGIFGPKTDIAARKFQEDAGIGVDGVVGSETRNSIATKLFTMGEVVRQGDRGAAVLLAQRRLDESGFDPGPIDGIFGQRTHSAVRNFQQSRELVVDGIIGPQTWMALTG